MKYFGLTVAATLLSYHVATAQNPVKEFFNEEWKQCDSAVASYYRVITYGDNGLPKGMVKDYYMSGELQWEGAFSYIDKYDSYNNKHEGLCTWYYKNGKKQTATFYSNGVQHGPSKGWYESGTRSYDCNYKKGDLDGLYVSWFETGLLQTFAYYNDGAIVGTDVYNCDEFGECGTTIMYKFVEPKLKKSKKNASLQDLFDLLSSSSYGYQSGKGDVKDFTGTTANGDAKTTYKGEGLILSAGKTDAFKTIFSPMDFSKISVITAKLTHVKGDASAKSGLVFAYKDDKNYYEFLVDKNGNYEVGYYLDGTYNELSKGSVTSGAYDSYDYLNYDSDKSSKKKETYYDFYISSYQDTFQCFLGYTSVYKTTGFKSNDNYMGYKIAAGSTIKIKDMSITREVDAPFVSADIDAKSMKNKAFKSTGSGFVVSTDGYIVTNHHVVDGATYVEVDLIRNGEVVSYTCDVIMKDEKSDLAVIKINDSTFTAYKEIPYTIKTDLSETGTNVYALGYPLAFSTLGNEIKYTEGSINARTGMDGDILAYQVSTPVQPGNSGGPLLDYDGNIIGVINSKLFYADNVAFAVKANYILNLLYLLPSKPDYSKVSKLNGLSAAEQVSIMREYVPLIKVR